MDILMLLGGLALLLGGGEVLVRGGVGLAARLGWSPAVIGAVVLGFGTLTPELMTSLQAAWQGSPGIAVGNVVGSNIANILLVLGLAAVLAPVVAQPGRTEWALLAATGLGVVLLLGDRLVPISVPPLLSHVDLAVFAASALVLVIMLKRSGVTRPIGLACVLLYAAYVGWLAVSAG